MQPLIYVPASAAIPTNLTVECLCDQAGRSVAGRGVTRSRLFNIKLQLFSLHIFNFSCSVWSSILETLKIHNIWSNIDHSYFACFIPAQTKTDRISFENNSSLGITEEVRGLQLQRINLKLSLTFVGLDPSLPLLQEKLWSHEGNLDKSWYLNI